MKKVLLFSLFLVLGCVANASRYGGGTVFAGKDDL